MCLLVFSSFVRHLLTYGCMQCLPANINMHLAPEVQQGNGSYSQAADVYAFGMLAFELCWGSCIQDVIQVHGRCTNPTASQGAVPTAASAGQATVSALGVPQGCPTALTVLLAACTQQQAARRPDANRILAVLQQLQQAVIQRGEGGV